MNNLLTVIFFFPSRLIIMIHQNIIKHDNVQQQKHHHQHTHRMMRIEIVMMHTTRWTLTWEIPDHYPHQDPVSVP